MADTPRRFVMGDWVAERARSEVWLVVEVDGCSISAEREGFGAERTLLHRVFRASRLVLIKASGLRPPLEPA